jgi:hypothetical protein
MVNNYGNIIGYYSGSTLIIQRVGGLEEGVRKIHITN